MHEKMYLVTFYFLYKLVYKDTFFHAQTCIHVYIDIFFEKDCYKINNMKGNDHVHIRS